MVLNPSLDVPPEHATALAEYVKGGGHLLVLDSAKNTKSTVNSVLWPYELTVNHRTSLAGQVTGPSGWPSVQTEAACEVKGGQALAHLEGRPVAAATRFGEGTVTVIGFSDGSRTAT